MIDDLVPLKRRWVVHFGASIVNVSKVQKLLTLLSIPSVHGEAKHLDSAAIDEVLAFRLVSFSCPAPKLPACHGETIIESALQIIIFAAQEILSSASQPDSCRSISGGGVRRIVDGA